MALQCFGSKCGERLIMWLRAGSTIGDTSQISPKATKTNISARNAVLRTATARRASTSDKCMARLAVLRSPMRNSPMLSLFRFRSEIPGQESPSPRTLPELGCVLARRRNDRGAGALLLLRSASCVASPSPRSPIAQTRRRGPREHDLKQRERGLAVGCAAECLPRLLPLACPAAHNQRRRGGGR